MTTPESNETRLPEGQHPADGSHAFPAQSSQQHPNAAPPAGGHYPPPPAGSAPYSAPPQAAPQYPAPQPVPGQQAPYQYPPHQYPAGQPGPQYGYPVAQPVRTPTGALSWALGFLIFLPIPFLSGIISGATMALTFGASARHGGVARENARSAANWGLTYVTLSLALMIVHFIVVVAFAGTSVGRGFLPIGIPFIVYVALSILHVVLVIMGTVKASSGTVMRVPFAIAYIRA